MASRTVTIEAGAQPQFAHTMEPPLRQLGLPVKMVRGVIHMERRHVLCRAGQRLNPEQCTLLKHFQQPMAEFQLALVAHWNRDGTFQRLRDREDVMAKNAAKGSVIGTTSDDETMEDCNMNEGC